MSVYEVAAAPYGMRIAYQGFPSAQDVAEMTGDIQRIIAVLPAGWGVLVDMRQNKAFSAESAEMMKQQIEACKRYGMQRAVVILQSAIMALQAKRISNETGILPFIRFIDAGSDPAWEQAAIAWLTRGVEPVG
jgi:hypothetical protein